MKRSLSLSFLTLLLPLSIWAQAPSKPFEVKLKLKDLKGQPMAGTLVTLTEIETRKTLKSNTDASGQVAFNLTEGKLWQIDILDIKGYFLWQINRDPAGGGYGRSLVYDYKTYLHDMRPPVDRSKLSAERIAQNVPADAMPDDKNSIVRVNLYHKDQTPVQKSKVVLLDVSNKKAYEASTDETGYAYFRLPVGILYEIDVDDLESYGYVDLEQEPSRLTKRFLYEPSTVQETMQADTAVQNLSPEAQPSSSRSLLTLTFKLSNGNPLANKPVVIKSTDNLLFYKGTTDAKGMVRLLVKPGKRYVYVQRTIGAFEDALDVADLVRTTGIAKAEKTIVLDALLPPMKTEVNFMMPKSLPDVSAFFAGQGYKITKFENNSIPFWSRAVLVYDDPKDFVGIKKGWLLTTGSVFNAIGPNDSPGRSAVRSWYTSKDKIPAAMQAPTGAFDPAIVDLEIVPEKNTLVLSYVFASEEYDEFKEFNDALGIFLDGDLKTNFATLPDLKTSICVANVNDAKNSEYFRSNQDSTKPSFQAWQYDGMLKRIERTIDVTPGKPLKIKLVIFDSRDAIYDSAAFIGIRCE